MSSRRRLGWTRVPLVEFLEVAQVADQTQFDGGRVADAAVDRVARLVDTSVELKHRRTLSVAAVEELLRSGRMVPVVHAGSSIVYLVLYPIM